MGLGPSVCKSCELYACLDNKTHVWYCPNCLRTDLDSLWEFKEEDQLRFKDHSKFYNFVRGKG